MIETRRSEAVLVLSLLLTYFAEFRLFKAEVVYLV